MLAQEMLVEQRLFDGLDLHRGLFLVVALDLLVAYDGGARHLAVEVVGMLRAQAGQRPPSLRPARSVARVGVNDPSDALEVAVEHEVCPVVGRKVQIVLHSTAA